MKPVLRLVILMAVGACTNLRVDAGGAPAVPIVSLCDAAANARAWNGRIVRMRAIYISDMVHISVLKDKACPQAGLAPRRANAFEPGEGAAYERWRKALVGDPADGSLRVFAIDVVGNIAWDDSDRRAGRFYLRKIISYRPVPNPFP
jgi:hypothetical protein